jgi:twitching motility protein PilT
MNLELQWFISGIVENNIMTLAECQNIVRQLGDNCQATAMAQEVLNQKSGQFEEEQISQLLEYFQALLAFAEEQAAAGSVPAIFANMTPAVPMVAASTVSPVVDTITNDGNGEHSSISDADISELPSLENVNKLNDEEVAALMIVYLRNLREMGASDLHMSAGSVPFIRSELNIVKLGSRIIPPADAMRLNTVLLNPEQKKIFDEEMDLNFALEVESNRFRVSLMMHKDGASGTYRLVPNRLRKLAELGFLPDDVSTIERLLDYHNGLILVTGPLGCGKTTTLASMVNAINKKRHDHVICVEDPVEILIPSENCNITQREVGKNTNSYSSALKGALREDPDIIVIGELHDLETIENAITASETGHLVIGTLHTCDAANTLNRLLDVFPPMQQPQIRAMTAGSLRGIICQRLLPGIGGKLAVSYEILLNTMAIGNIISEGKTHHLKGVMQTGAKAGMCTFDTNLLNLFKAGRITVEMAESQMKDKAVIKQLREESAIAEAKKYAATNKKK